MSEADRLMAELEVLMRECEADMRALHEKTVRLVAIADALTDAALRECTPSPEERESILAVQRLVHGMAAKLGG